MATMLNLEEILPGAGAVAFPEGIRVICSECSCPASKLKVVYENWGILGIRTDFCEECERPTKCVMETPQAGT